MVIRSQAKSTSSSIVKRWFPTILGIALSLGLLGVVSLVDATWSQGLTVYGQNPWVYWMDQSFFEGESLGASDLPLILYGLVFLWYLAVFLVVLKAGDPRGERKPLQNVLGRVLLTGLCVALATHALKWGIDRPRPKDVLKGVCLYREWFEFGSICTAKYQGRSFPSGHTATAASLWAMNAAWMGWPPKNPKFRPLLSLIIPLCVMVFALAMGLSRVMHGDHWLTDVLASVLLGLWSAVIFWRKEILWFFR